MINCRTTKLHGIFAAVLLTLAACNNHEQVREIAPTKVKTTRMTQATPEAFEFAYSGLIIPGKTVTISAQLSGTIDKILVELGSYVSKGDLIAEINNTAYLKQYEAHKAQAELAKENYDRIKEVYDKGSIAEMRLIEARSNYQQATAAAAASYQNIKHAKIYAPISGYVGEKFLEAGDLANPGTRLINLLEINEVKASSPLPDNEVNNYKAGDVARVRIEALNKEFTGKIHEISIQSTAGTPSYAAKVAIENAANSIKPGMACTIYLAKDKQEHSNRFLIPTTAVIPDEAGNYFVYVADKKAAVAKKVQIQIGALYDEGIEVLSGIKLGDQLITSGYHKLTNNTPIEIIK